MFSEDLTWTRTFILEKFKEKISNENKKEVFKSLKILISTFNVWTMDNGWPIWAEVLSFEWFRDAAFGRRQKQRTPPPFWENDSALRHCLCLLPPIFVFNELNNVFGSYTLHTQFHFYTSTQEASLLPLSPLCFLSWLSMASTISI